MINEKLYDIKLDDNHNIIEFLYGKCHLFLAYFLERNPDWKGEYFFRKGNHKIIHAYAVHIREDGVREYADVRGRFTDEKKFYRGYDVRGRMIEVRTPTEEQLHTWRQALVDQEAEAAAKTAYSLVFEREQALFGSDSWTGTSGSEQN